MAPHAPQSPWCSRAVQESPFFTVKLGIKVLPVVIMFKEGVTVGRIIGFEQLGEQAGGSPPALAWQPGEGVCASGRPRPPLLERRRIVDKPTSDQTRLHRTPRRRRHAFSAAVSRALCPSARLQAARTTSARQSLRSNCVRRACFKAAKQRQAGGVYGAAPVAAACDVPVIPPGHGSLCTAARHDPAAAPGALSIAQAAHAGLHLGTPPHWQQHDAPARALLDRLCRRQLPPSGGGQQRRRAPAAIHQHPARLHRPPERLG